MAVTGVAVTTGLVVARQLTAFVDNAHLLAERDALAARLHTMAFTDSLTGLANRALFHDRLAEMVRSAGPVAVLLIDLDDFKPVNDAYGHAAGDAVLVETAVRLRRGVREADVVARLGGDEFAVLIGGPEPGDLAATAARIVRDIAEPVAVDGARQVTVRASVGVTTTCGGADPSTLLKAADEAMYRAKCAGKGSFHLAGRA